MTNYISLKDGSIFEDSNGNIVQVVKKNGKYYLYDINYEQWLNEEIEEYIFNNLDSIIETYKSAGNPIERVIK